MGLRELLETRSGAASSVGGRLLGSPRSLRWRLIILLAVQAVVVALVAYGLARWQESQDLARANERNQIATIDRLQRETARALGEIVLLQRLNGDALRTGLLDATGLQGIDRQFWQQMQRLPDLRFLGFGNELRFFVGTVRRPGGAIDLQLANPSAGAGNSNLQIFATDSQGNRAGAARQAGTMILAQLPWYEAAAQAGQATWQVAIDGESGDMVATTAAPIYDLAGRRLGIIAVGSSLTGLGAMLDRLKPGTDSTALLVDRAGTIVSQRPTATALTRSPLSEAAPAPGASPKIDPSLRSAGVAALMARVGRLSAITEAVTAGFTWQGQAYEAIATPLRSPSGRDGLPDWLVMAIAPSGTWAGSSTGSSFPLAPIIIALAAGASALAVSRWVYRWFNQPLSTLSRAARAIAAGQPETSPVLSVEFNEFGDLAESLRQLGRDRSLATLDRQRPRPTNPTSPPVNTTTSNITGNITGNTTTVQANLGSGTSPVPVADRSFPSFAGDTDQSPTTTPPTGFPQPAGLATSSPPVTNPGYKTIQQAREAIDSEARFARLFQLSPHALCLMRLEDGRVLEFNPAFLEVVGYGFEELMGFTNVELNWWSDPSDRALVLNALIRGSTVANREVVIRTKSRTRRTVLLSAEPIYWQGRDCALFAFNDITDYRHLEEELRLSQERLEDQQRRHALEALEGSRDELRYTLDKLESVLGAVQDALVWTDREGRVDWCNNAFERLVGVDRAEASGLPLARLLPLVHRGRPLPIQQHPGMIALNAGTGSGAYEFQHGSDRLSLEIAWSGVALPDPAATNGRADSAVLAIRDITERKRLIAEVVRAKRFIDGIIENIPLAVFVKDVQNGFRLLLWNRACEGLYGIARDQAIGRTPDELYPIKRATIVLEHDESVVDRRDTVEIPEEVVETPRGKRIVRTINVPLLDGRGRVAYILGISEDISQRKHAETALRESQAQFRLLAEQAGGDLMFVHDVRGQILDVNQQACRLLGYVKEELLTLNIKDIDTQAALDQHDRIWAMMQSSQPVTLEGMYRCKNGRTFPVETRVGMRQQAQGHKIFLAVGRDVTDRRQMEEALQTAEEKYRSIVENAVEGIFQCAPNGQFLSGNVSLARMFGYDNVEMMLSADGLNRTRRFYTDPDRWTSFLTSIAVNHSISSFESQVFDRYGNEFWVSENARAVHDEEGRLIYYEGTIQNITERKLAEEALFIEQEKADRLLLNVLPKAIADRLKQGEGLLAEQYDEATILFADLVGFTPLSTQLQPIELVDVLNRIFSFFDHLADRHNLEKIKTVGDEYMVVGGLPLPLPDHTAAVAQMALDMQQSMHQFLNPQGKPFQIRIGLHTGSVVAGVIGIKKFTYDLWGDTVNVASRMESQGEPGRIQVTQMVYERIKDRFIFEDRGALEVKGRGEMSTYWLIGPK